MGSSLPLSVILLSLYVLLVQQCHAQVSLSPSPTITVDEDNDVTFTCSGVTGRQVLQVNSNFTIIPTDRITLISQDKSGSQYQFTGLTREDNGTSLQCFSNAVMSNIVTIIVDFPPRFNPDSISYIVMEGTSPYIELGLDAAPRIANFTWTKDNVEITSTPRVILGVNTLKFNPISRQDSGQYLISVDDQLGSGNATISLDVYYAPEFVAGQDTINISVISGYNITLNCAAMANPNIIHLNLTYTSNTANNIDITSTSFVITSATTNNQGSYTCTATNLVAIKQLVYNLIVGALPNLPSFQLSIEITTTSVIISATYTDNNPQPVQQFYVTVNSVTYTIISFPLEIDINQFTAGQSYTVTVIAENAIGNTTLTSHTFTIPRPTPTPTPGSAGGAGHLSSVLLTMMIIAGLYLMTIY